MPNSILLPLVLGNLDRFEVAIRIGVFGNSVHVPTQKPSGHVHPEKIGRDQYAVPRRLPSFYSLTEPVMPET